MTNTIANNLTKEKIQQLLAVVGSQPTKDDSQIESTEYDWNKPNYFNSEQLNLLNDFTEKIAKVLTNKFKKLFRSDFDVTIAPITQHYIKEFLISSEQSNDFYLLFETEQKKTCGLISMPPQTAITWATQLLGDSQAENDTDRELSKLEMSLLIDIVTAISKAFITACSKAIILKVAGNVLKGDFPLELPDTSTMQVLFTGQKNRIRKQFRSNYFNNC